MALSTTPMIDQYRAIKVKHPDAVLLFRFGDFYEAFGDDAIIVSEICGFTLTRRANGKASSIELAGFPHYALDTYLPKLVRACKRVAICEQLENPRITTRFAQHESPLSSQSHSSYGINALLVAFISILPEFCDIINKLHTFEEIRVKTLELESLSEALGISACAAFDECRKISMPSLFDGE